MKKIIWLIAGIVLLGLIALITPAPAPYTPPTQQVTTPSAAVIETASPQVTGAKTLTVTEVAKHTSASSCYTIVAGQVYDLTQWVGQHPGGEEAILSLCGSDGTAAFEAQHGSSEKAQGVLSSYLIGSLQK